MGNFGILVSGGPAPAINCVISSAVIEANKRGFKVFGINGGFQGLCDTSGQAVKQLGIDDVTPFFSSGGSLLGTSRFNPFNKPELVQNIAGLLHDLSIDKLIVIGGDGSAYLSNKLIATFPGLRVAHVPKTIDNDLPLPHNYPSLGFESARMLGSSILETLMLDAKTSQRWFLVSCMGRRAGFLALGLGLSAGSTLTLIPEEFHSGVKLEQLCNPILSSISQRCSQAKNYGVAVLAEGLLDLLDPESAPELKTCPKDDLGRLVHSEIEIAKIISGKLKQQCQESALRVTIRTDNVGYEIRSQRPVPFDLEYGRFLGFGAVSFLANAQPSAAPAAVIVRDYDQIGFVALSSMMDSSGKVKARHVDISSDLFKVASSFMVRY